MENKFNQEIVTITDPAGLKNYPTYYTGERVLKSWTEDFADKDTGDIITIERNEVLFDRGMLLNDIYSQLLFHMQSGDVSTVLLSNQCRNGAEIKSYTATYMISIEVIGKKRSKAKYLLHSNSVEHAIACIKDYCELEIFGAFEILAVKKIPVILVVDNNLVRVENEQKEDDPKYYHVSFVLTEKEEGFSNIHEGIVKAYSLELAKSLLVDFIQKERNNDISIEIEEAKILKIDEFISDEFSLAYNDNLEGK